MKAQHARQQGSTTLIEVAFVSLLSLVFFAWYWRIGGDDGSANKLLERDKCMINLLSGKDASGAARADGSATLLELLPDDSDPCDELAAVPTAVPTSTPNVDLEVE